MIEIERKDLLFCVPLLDSERKGHLFKLAGVTPLRSEEEHFCELLSERASPLHDLVGADIPGEGAGDTARVKAAMAVKPCVLGSNERVDQHHGHIGESHGRAVFQEKFGEQLVIIRIDPRRNARPVFFEVPDLGQIPDREHEEASRTANEHGSQDHEEIEDQGFSFHGCRHYTLASWKK
jgi:hypothetical protein